MVTQGMTATECLIGLYRMNLARFILQFLCGRKYVDKAMVISEKHIITGAIL